MSAGRDAPDNGTAGGAVRHVPVLIDEVIEHLARIVERERT